MKKTLRHVIQLLASLPAVFFALISLPAMNSLKTALILTLGLALYSLAGFGLVSRKKELHLVGLLSLVNLALITRLGQGSDFTILYIVAYYGVVYGLSSWSYRIDRRTQ